MRVRLRFLYPGIRSSTADAADVVMLLLVGAKLSTPLSSYAIY